jgi:hypothetical protein
MISQAAFIVRRLIQNSYRSLSFFANPGHATLSVAPGKWIFRRGQSYVAVHYWFCDRHTADNLFISGR